MDANNHPITVEMIVDDAGEDIPVSTPEFWEGRTEDDGWDFMMTDPLDFSSNV